MKNGRADARANYSRRAQRGSIGWPDTRRRIRRKGGRSRESAPTSGDMRSTSQSAVEPRSGNAAPRGGVIRVHPDVALEQRAPGHRPLETPPSNADRATQRGSARWQRKEVGASPEPSTLSRVETVGPP